jgi:hypothetical protein
MGICKSKPKAVLMYELAFMTYCSEGVTDNDILDKMYADAERDGCVD